MDRMSLLKKYFLFFIILGHFAVNTATGEDMETIAVYQGPGAVLANEVEDLVSERAVNGSGIGLCYRGRIRRRRRSGGPGNIRKWKGGPVQPPSGGKRRVRRGRGEAGEPGAVEECDKVGN